MVRLYIFAVITLGALAGCMTTEPIYRTDTSYTAPTTTQGNACVASCQTTEQICRGREDDHRRAEYPGCMDRAKSDYNQCRKYFEQSNCDIGRRADENKCNKRRTPSYKSCTQSFNSCYRNCGGQVFEKQICVENCDG